MFCFRGACQFLSRVETPTLRSKPSLVSVLSSVSHLRAADSNYVMEKMDEIRFVCVWVVTTCMFMCVRVDVHECG